MAIYSNFDGTFKTTIQVGKKGPKITSDDQNFKVTNEDGTQLSTLSIGIPTADDHATTKQYLDSKFGTEDAKVRTNIESDALYQAIAERNAANGYVGLDADAKIESKYLPSVAINETYTVHNEEERNALVVNRGDMAIILSIPVWSAGTSYKKDTIVKVLDTATTDKFYFYVALKDHNSAEPAPSGVTDNWGISTFQAGPVAYTIGQEVLYDKKLYISLVAETHAQPVTDVTKFREDNTSDSGLYICSSTPTGPNGTSVNENWSRTDFGAQVTTWNGRTGTLKPISGDYASDMITFKPDAGLTSVTSQAAIVELANSRVKKAGDIMTGTLGLINGTAMLPSLVFGTNTKTGLFMSTESRIGFSYNEALKLSIGSTISSHAELAMNNYRVTNLGDPVSPSDAATKKYIDDTPLITHSPQSPIAAAGKNTDVHFRTKIAGPITAPFSAIWTAIATDGEKYIVTSNALTTPNAMVSDNSGETWSMLNMPSSGKPSDAFKYIMSNGPGRFLAIRNVIDPASVNSRLVYTLDSGKTWVSLTDAVFSGKGSFIPVKSSSSSNYILLPNIDGGTTAYYSGNSGVTWSQSALPFAAKWVSGVTVGKFVIAITNDYRTAISEDGGATWSVGGVLPSTDNAVYTSITSTNGVNIVAISTQGQNKLGFRCAYSNNSGKSWSVSAMPETSGNVPAWADISANNSIYVAVAPTIGYVARSVDGGVTWQRSTLPSTQGWKCVASTGANFVAIDSLTTTINPVVISKDNGVTWENRVEGGINNIFIKQNSNWVPYRGITTTDGDIRYVSKTGDQMTGRLIIDNGTNGYSLQVTGGIKAAGKIESLPYLTNSEATSLAGRIELGVTNQDAVLTDKIYKWNIATDGTNNGYTLRIQSNTRSIGLDKPAIDRVVFSPSNTVISSPLGINKAASASLFHIDQAPTDIKTSLSIYTPNGKANVELISGQNNVTTDLIRCYSGVPSINYNDASALTSANTTYRVTSSGAVQASSGYMAGNGVIDQTARFKAFVVAGQRGIVIDSSAAVINAANITAIDIKSRATNELNDTYSHINVVEGTTQVLWVGRSKAVIMKRVGINAPASEHANLVIGGTDAVQIPSGTDAQRPATPSAGMMRHNSATDVYEVYRGGEWTGLNTGSYSYNTSFNKGDWTTVAGNSTIKILAATHKLGLMPYCVFQEQVASGNFAHSHMYYEVAPNGDITIMATVDNPIDLPAIRVFVHA